MKILFILTCILLFAAACSKTVSVKTVEMKNTARWDSGLRGNNQAGLSGLYNGEVFVWGEQGESFIMAFFSIDGQKSRELTFKKGKGPGEIQFPMVGKIIGDTIAIYDYWLRRISLFSLDGKTIDDIAINDPDLFNVSNFFIAQNAIYLHCSDKCLLASIDIATGEIIKKIPYEKTDTDVHSVEIPILGGSMYYDENKKTIFIAYSNGPFHIDSFDLSLNKKETINPPLTKNYEAYRFKVIKSGKSVYMVSVGDNLSTSLESWKGKLIIPIPVHTTYTENGTTGSEPDNGFYIIDPVSKKVTGAIYDDVFRKTAGLMYFIIGVKDNTIICAVYPANPEEYEKSYGKDTFTGLALFTFEIVQ